MSYPRLSAIPLLTFALAACVPVTGQSVVSTHSGLVYFFEGSVFLGGQQLEQKFGRFPDIGEGRELRTEHGRAEVLLTPDVFLRMAENSAIRLISNKLSDTQVELVAGSAILDSNAAGKHAPIKVIHKNWQVQLTQQGVYRIDSDPAQLRVYRGEVEVSTTGKPGTVAVETGELLPLVGVLVPEKSTLPEGDMFKTWALNRSQAISADNAIAAQIVDDPDQMDSAGQALGSVSYFPPTGIPSLGITNPYGMSFWSPYQSTLTSMYFPAFYGSTYIGWPTRTLFRPYPGQGLVIGSGLMPTRVGIGFQPAVGTLPRAPVGLPARPIPVVAPPRVGGRAPVVVHAPAGVHR